MFFYIFVNFKQFYMAAEFVFEYDKKILKNDKGIYYCNFHFSYKDLRITLEKQLFSRPSEDFHFDKIRKNNPLKQRGFKEINNQRQVIRVKIEVLKYLNDVSLLVYNKWKTL